MTKQRRLRIDRHFRIHEYEDEILVKCPNCGHCARALAPQWDSSERSYTISMSCLHCSRQHNFVVTSWKYWNQLPLWLKTSCGEVLWALNSRHVMALQDYVEAGLRENKLGTPSTRHMYMSLPRWITSRKNRADVLRGLRRLQAKLMRTE